MWLGLWLTVARMMQLHPFWGLFLGLQPSCSAARPRPQEKYIQRIILTTVANTQREGCQPSVDVVFQYFLKSPLAALWQLNVIGIVIDCGSNDAIAPGIFKALPLLNLQITPKTMFRHLWHLARYCRPVNCVVGQFRHKHFHFQMRVPINPYRHPLGCQ